MAGAPRKVFWKIDYYSDASRAFGAEDTFDITHCYRVLSKQISVIHWTRADHLSATESVIERN